MHGFVFPNPLDQSFGLNVQDFSHLDIVEINVDNIANFGHVAYSGTSNPRVKIFSFYVTSNMPAVPNVSGFQLRIYSDNAGTFIRSGWSGSEYDTGYYCEYGITLYPAVNNYPGVSFICDVENIKTAVHPVDQNVTLEDVYDLNGQTLLNAWRLTDGADPLDASDFVFQFDHHEYAIWHYGWDVFLHIDENFSLYEGDFQDVIHLELTDI